MTPRLYSYFRSSASWRVRIALAWKGVAYETLPVNLRGAGEQHGPAYRAINPQGLVPTFVEDGLVLGQSVAICEYLEERHPDPALLPREPARRAAARELVQAIACDIHPLNNTRVLQYLREHCGRSQEETEGWYRHWIATGFESLEQMLARHGAGPYCLGAAVSMADVFLVPQVFNARRWNVDLTAYARIVAIDANLCRLPAFSATSPEHQPDAQ